MLPLYDVNPTRRPPIVTVGIIAVCIIVFLIQLGVGLNKTIMAYGAIPVELLTGKDISPHISIPVTLTALTSMFMHAGFFHLLFNMLYLWIFGNNVEDYLGHLGFLAFYIASGLGALAAHVLVCIAMPSSHCLRIPVVGASGAISGVLAAYMVLYPDARVFTLVTLGFFWTTMELPALVVIGIWFFFQVINGLLHPAGSSVAWFAHIGGFVTGLFLIILVRTLFRRGPQPQEEYVDAEYVPELPHEYWESRHHGYHNTYDSDGYLDIWDG